jgi:hypothetical protein
MRHETQLPIATLVLPQALGYGFYYPVKQKCSALVVAAKQREFGKTAFIIQPIERLVTELIKLTFFSFCLQLKLWGSRFKGGEMICQTS